MKLFRGDSVLTPDGNGYVVYGSYPTDKNIVKVILIKGAEVKEYKKELLICLPEYRRSNPKIDIYDAETGEYINSTKWHKTIARLKKWYEFSNNDITRYIFKIDHN